MGPFGPLKKSYSKKMHGGGIRPPPYIVGLNGLKYIFPKKRNKLPKNLKKWQKIANNCKYQILLNMEKIQKLKMSKNSQKRAKIG